MPKLFGVAGHFRMRKFIASRKPLFTTLKYQLRCNLRKNLHYFLALIINNFLPSDIVILGFTSDFIIAFEVIFLYDRYWFLTDQA